MSKTISQTFKNKTILQVCILFTSAITLTSSLFGFVLFSSSQNTNSASALSLASGTVFETISSGFGNWTKAPQNSNNLWTLINPEPEVLLPAGVSGQSYRFFNQPTNNYNNGQIVKGSLISPIINLPSSPNQLQTTLTHEVQTESNLDFDQLTITATTAYPVCNNACPGLPSFSKVIWNKGDLQNQVADADFLSFQGQTQLDLSEFSGQPIQLSFNFDSKDYLYNDFSGWEIKGLSIFQDQFSSSSSSSNSRIIWQPTTLIDWEKQNIQEPQTQFDPIVKENLWDSYSFATHSGNQYSSSSSTGSNEVYFDLGPLQVKPSLAYKNVQSNNYVTGRVGNGGLIVSPTIQVPVNQELDFKFSSILDVESDNNYDLANVKIITDDNQFSLNKNNLTVSSSTQSDQSLKFSSTSGSIQIVFSFDTVDALFNTTTGWEVSDLRIVSTL